MLKRTRARSNRIETLAEGVGCCGAAARGCRLALVVSYAVWRSASALISASSGTIGRVAAPVQWVPRT